MIDQVLRYPYRLNTSLSLHFWCPISVILSSSSRLGLYYSVRQTCTPFQGPVVTREDSASYSISSSSQALVRPHSLPSPWKVPTCRSPSSSLFWCYRICVYVYGTRCYVLFSSFLSSFGPRSIILQYCIRTLPFFIVLRLSFFKFP